MFACCGYRRQGDRVPFFFRTQMSFRGLYILVSRDTMCSSCPFVFMDLQQLRFIRDILYEITILYLVRVLLPAILVTSMSCVAGSDIRKYQNKHDLSTWNSRSSQISSDWLG